jgi:histidyl-tRNA synthetase
MTKHNLQPVRGTKDLHSQAILHFNHIVEIAKKQAKNFGFDELHTPIFEFSEIFLQNLGESSDIINKEVYAFFDRSQNSLTLRPEFTKKAGNDNFTKSTTKFLVATASTPMPKPFYFLLAF